MNDQQYTALQNARPKGFPNTISDTELTDEISTNERKGSIQPLASDGGPAMDAE